MAHPELPRHQIRLGSITKQFTAACILLLQERGELDVHDPLKKFLPDEPPAWDKITLFNLLTHTSGIPNYTALADFPAEMRAHETPLGIIAHVSETTSSTKWSTPRSRSSPTPRGKPPRSSCTKAAAI